MKFIKNQFAPWPIILLIGLAALAISLAARVSPSTIAADREYHSVERAAIVNEHVDVKDSTYSKTTVSRSVARPQDYYDRRREYWEDRVDRQLDDEEFDDEAGDDKDADSKKDSKTAKDEKADKDDSADSDMDKEEELIERRREYWRDRLDREW